jgi:hypothetical protein
MTLETRFSEFSSVEDLIAYTKHLETGYEVLMAHCRGTLDCRGGARGVKGVVNYVDYYCNEVLDGRLPNIDKD